MQPHAKMENTGEFKCIFQSRTSNLTSIILLMSLANQQISLASKIMALKDNYIISKPSLGLLSSHIGADSCWLCEY